MPIPWSAWDLGDPYFPNAASHSAVNEAEGSYWLTTNGHCQFRGCSHIDWCHPDSPATSGLNKGSHFRLESTPISQNALLLLVSGKMSLNVAHQQRLFPSKYRMSNENIPARICTFWIDQWRPWFQSTCTV